MATDFGNIPSTLASPSAPGTMSAADKTKLDTYPANGTTALAAKEDAANKGAANGYAGLDADKSVLIRDTSAAYDHAIKSTSSSALTAKRTTTLDAKNTSNTLDVPALAAVCVREGDRKSGTAGANCTSLDITGLACDTKGPFVAIIRGSTTTDTSSTTISLRINGSSSNIVRDGHYWDTEGGNPVALGGANSSICQPNGANPLAGAKWSIIVEAMDVKSGRVRDIRVKSVCELDPTTPTRRHIVYTMTFQSTDEITSIGVETSAALDIAAATTYEVIRL